MSNVKAMPNCRVPTDQPNVALVGALTDLLAMAKDGRLQSFIGTGFAADCGRVAVWGDFHSNVYEMRGALAWLESEYVHQHTEEQER